MPPAKEPVAPTSAPSWGAGEEGLYSQINRRLSDANGAGATMITVLTVVAIWGQWHAVAIVVAIQVVIIAFNIWVNLSYLPRRGPSAELVRSSVNLTSSFVVNHVAGWPAPVWLWLPFTALAFDHIDRRVARWTLVAFCAAQDGVAVLDGVGWLYPLTFTLFAIFCSEISRLRFASIRDTLIDSDWQRRQIEEAHEELKLTHDRLEAETQQRFRLEVELRQAQKLEAVGRLASGVAHEINTPVQYVGDSIAFLGEATGDLLSVVEKLRAVQRAVLEGSPAARAAAVDAQQAELTADLPYLLENVPKACDRAREGLERVATIVRSMREFAHPDAREMTLVDLNRSIDATLVVAHNEYKYVADVERDYGDIPPVTCHGGDVNQVVLNLLVNAAHAIGDVVGGSSGRGKITVRTRHDGEHVVVSISDTGTGIPEAVRDRVFDPFFTTKEVGRGTGQGLAMARSVVVDKHGGTITLETEVGKGTTFHVRLPVHGRGEQLGAAA